jgi:hypothetical protein
MTRKRFTKLCMSFVDRNTAIDLANKAIPAYESYKNAYEYLNIYRRFSLFGYLMFGS